MNPSVERQQHSDDPQQRELLRVCRIGRAQGLKGEVTVQIFTDEPEYRFAPDSVLYTRDGSQEYVVEYARTFKNRWIVKFEGIDDRDASEAANGIELYGEADDPEDMLEEDAWYPKDLVGLEARLAEGNGLGLPAGQVIGKVVDVLDSAQTLLKIRLVSPVRDAVTGEVTESTALVPFVDELVPRHRPRRGVSDDRPARRADSGTVIRPRSPFSVRQLRLSDTVIYDGVVAGRRAESGNNAARPDA